MSIPNQIKAVSRKDSKNSHSTTNFLSCILTLMQYFETLKKYIYWRKTEKYETVASQGGKIPNLNSCLLSAKQLNLFNMTVYFDTS